MPERRQHFQVWTAGTDESLQGIGGDAWASSAAVGLRVPTIASTIDAPSTRYLMMLCGLWLAEGVKARIIGIRQLVTIATVQSISGSLIALNKGLIEQEVTSSAFRFPDGNVSFSLTLVPPSSRETLLANQAPPIQGVDNLAFRMSDTPALLYETATLANPAGPYVNLTAYQAPNQGRPYGQPIGQLTSFNDKRNPWQTNQGMHPLSLPIEGPGFLAMWASVAQTGGVTLTAPTDAGALPPEWRFIAAYPNAVKYWRVAGALDVEILGVNDVGDP